MSVPSPCRTFFLRPVDLGGVPGLTPSPRGRPPPLPLPHGQGAKTQPEENQTVRVVQLKAENFKRLQAVEVTPDGNLVVISGANGQGKSSLLDAMWAAIGGAAAMKGTPRPIRDGEDHATVTVDLGDLKVTRTWKGDKTTLRVENADGARYSSPQAVLDRLVGRLSFDPLAFAGQSERDQLATLLALVDLPFDPADIARDRQRLFDERTSVNKALRHLDAQIAALPEPAPDLPAEEVSVADLMRQLRTAQEARSAQSQRTERYKALVDAHAQTTSRIAELRAEIARLEVDLTGLVEEIADIRVEIDRDDTDPVALVAALEKQISEADSVNRAVRAAKDRAALMVELTHTRETSQALTDDIAALDARKAKAVAEAKMPIDGLGFNDDGVTYRGIPFAQCSSAERLRVSMAMAMAMNPTLRVIRITDGSLLDSQSMRLIEEMAADNDTQVWVEVVDESGRVGVVIEDGLVAETPAAVAE
jgi:DNA repair exonuclease SbcCD ATPase subunit